MSEKLTEISSREFAKKLSAKVSVPGGGGAAALVGAYAVALCSMSANFTTGKKKYAEYEDDLQRILKQGDMLRERLLDLVEEDEAAFEPLSRAYGIPKEDPERAGKLEEATLVAIQPPLKMMRVIAESVLLLNEMLVKSSVLMVSDVGCGAILAKAALTSASINVFINTKSLRNRDKAAEIEAEADELLSVYAPMADSIVDAVTKKLRG